VWRLPAAHARRAVAALRAERILARAEPDQRFVPFGPATASSDPLVPNEWWIHDVGDDQVEAPGPGVPITVLDTGLDLSHPEFKSRPNTTALNTQVVVASNDPAQEPEHGTAVSSVAAAPSNGVGLVGVYPEAALREWDFGDGLLSEVLAGLDTASGQGPAVVNSSGGFVGSSTLLEEAFARALRRGTIVVAAVGNERQRGNRSFVPASLPHVLTVGGTNQSDHVTSFSNRSSALDLAAPAVDMPVAV